MNAPDAQLPAAPVDGFPMGLGLRPRRVRSQRRRVQLDLLQDVYARVVDVQHAVGLDSARDVFREAFRFYEWYVTRRLEGWSLQIVDAQGRVKSVEVLGDVLAKSRVREP
jgi:hypothetical protein